MADQKESQPVVGAFDCFGGEEDDSDDNNSQEDTTEQGKTPNAAVAAGSHTTAATTRDPGCGILKFHSGTEQSLWLFLQRKLEDLPRLEEGNEAKPTTIINRAKLVLQMVDEFCYSRHWMMAVGPEKGKILTDFVQEFCQKYQSRRLSGRYPTAEDLAPIILVELGTYCGYSAILIALKMLELLPINAPANFHLYSVDVDANFQAVAQKLVMATGLERYITFLLLPMNAATSTNDEHPTLTRILQQQQQPAIPRIDFLFIDHDKDLYCPDLQELEQSGLIQAGTFVAADNVVFFDIPYRSYIRQLQSQGIVESRLVKSHLEYFLHEELAGGAPNVFQDGIELSIYLKSPRSVSHTRKLD